MLKTDVFVWLTVNCKSLNFCSVDTLSAQLHCHMDYFIYCPTRTVHTCRTAALHAILSFLISLFASYDPQSHKILQFYCFQILLSKKVGKPWPPWPHPPRRICRPPLHYNNVRNMLKVNDKDTRTTITSLGVNCYHWTNSKPFTVFIVEFALLWSM